MNPDFSIVTPTFRQLDWLRLCISSVRDQVSVSLTDSESSRLKIEHIIQDAGTQGIEKIAREYGAEFYVDAKPSHSWITNADRCLTIKIFSEKDSGMYDAINRGFARSSGGICAWLNSDEQYLGGTLLLAKKFFEQDSRMDVLLGDAILSDAQLTPVCYRRIMVPGLFHTRLVHLHSLSCAMFFRKSCLPTPPLEPQWKVIGDAVLMERWLQEGRKIRACGMPLSLYSFTGNNLSAGHLGSKEHTQWLAATGFTGKWLKPAIVMLHRLRRMMHRAYGRFSVSLDYHAPGGRRHWQGRLPGTWPKSA